MNLKAPEPGDINIDMVFYPSPGAANPRPPQMATTTSDKFEPLALGHRGYPFMDSSASNNTSRIEIRRFGRGIKLQG